MMSPTDVACPRCQWTLLTGGMTEEAHAAVCGPIPGRRSPGDFSAFIEKSQRQSRPGEDGPAFNIGENPIPRIEPLLQQDQIQLQPAASTAAAGPSRFFKFTFSIANDFKQQGDELLLRLESFQKAISDANVPSSINQPPGSVEDAVRNITGELAPLVRASQESQSQTFNQFSGTFMVEVMP